MCKSGQVVKSFESIQNAVKMFPHFDMLEHFLCSICGKCLFVFQFISSMQVITRCNINSRPDFSWVQKVTSRRLHVTIKNKRRK